MVYCSIHLEFRPLQNVLESYPAICPKLTIAASIPFSSQIFFHYLLPLVSLSPFFRCFHLPLLNLQAKASLLLLQKHSVHRIQNYFLCPRRTFGLSSTYMSSGRRRKFYNNPRFLRRKLFLNLKACTSYYKDKYILIPSNKK